MTVPGLRGAHHVGVTVPDLDEAISFFVEVLGCVEVHVLPAMRGDGDWMKENLGVHPEAVLDAIALLRCGDGSNLELLQFSAPDQQTTPPGNADVGSAHVAFEVDDVGAAVASLRSQGIEVQGEPKTVAAGPRAGVTWVYFRAPWGLQLELISSGPETDGTPALWSPSRSRR